MIQAGRLNKNASLYFYPPQNILRFRIYSTAVYTASKTFATAGTKTYVRPTATNVFFPLNQRREKWYDGLLALKCAATVSSYSDNGVDVVPWSGCVQSNF